MTWRTVQLGDVLVPSRNLVRIEPNKTYKQITARLWGKGLRLRGICNGSEIAAEKQVAVNTGDFLISKIDARHGAFGLVPESLSGAVVSTDFPCFAINNEVMDSDFLNWFSKTGSFIAMCKKSSVGSTNRVRLKEDQFLTLEVPLPSLHEQILIGRLLNSASVEIAEITRLTAEAAGELNSLVYSLHTNLSENDPVRFGSLIELDERQIPVEPDDEFPQLGLRSFGKGLFYKEAIKGSETAYKKFNQVYQGALIVSQPKGWEGAVAVATSDHESWFVSPEYRTFRCVEQKLDPDYLAALILTSWFQSILSKMTRGQGARRERLRPEMLTEFKLRMPSLDAQKAALKIIKDAQLASAHLATRTREAQTLIPAMLHEIFERKAFAPIKAARPNVVSLPEAKPLSIETPFMEAVLVGAIIKAFHEEGGQPLGNFRLQKAVYFARRYLGERALDQQYLRKAAGPYNPTLRYSGGIKIALEKNWIAAASGRFGPGQSPGSAFGEARAWIEKYQFSKPAAWVRDKFKFKHNDTWELLATVDYAMLAIEHGGKAPNAANVFAYICNDVEWHPKVEKLQLSEASIQNAITELESLFASVTRAVGMPRLVHPS